MCQCVLYTTKYKEEIKDKIEAFEKEIEWDSELKVTQQGNIYELRYKVRKLTVGYFEMLAQIISDIVQRETIIEMAKEYLAKRTDLVYLDKQEIQRSFVTSQYLSGQEGFSSFTYYLIYMPILEALKEYKELNVDGWIRFRNNKSKIILRDMLEQFIEDYLVKKDFINFIKLIREINTLTEPLEDTIHVIYEEYGEIRLLNDKMQDTTKSYIKKYCSELLKDSTLKRQDLIMNVLITVCPTHIIIHQKQKATKPQFFKVLEGIFGLSVEYCEGCKFCSKED